MMSGFDRLHSATIAKQGALALSKLVKPDGEFIYRYRLCRRPREDNHYNVLRHCGSAWAMLEVARALGPLPEVAEAAGRAVHFMIKKFLAPFGEKRALCVVDSGRIKLGGAGLAILALAGMHRETGNKTFLDIARRLGRYIRAEQGPNGDFIHSRIYPSGEIRSFRSDYYTGEALFGLLVLHEHAGDPEDLEAVVKCEATLMRSDYGVKEQSHWMLYALEQLCRQRPSTEYAEHARKIVEDILCFPGYRDRDRSTPIACRSEGLMAYARLLQQSGIAGLSPSEAASLREVGCNLHLQSRYMTAAGEFLRGGEKDEIRIDYIQHNISSFLAFATHRDGSDCCTPTSLYRADHRPG
jgi:hypothetical protein